MDGGKVGSSTSNRAQQGEDGDERRKANSLPDEGAGPSRQSGVGIGVPRQKSAADAANEAPMEGGASTRPEVPTCSKYAADDHRQSASKMVKLRKFLPESQVIDYEEVDSRRVRLCSFSKDVKAEDVADLCEGAVETNTLRRGDRLVHINALYGTVEQALATVQALDGRVVKGKPIRARYLGERWQDPETCPPVSSDILDVCNVPSEFPSHAELVTTLRDPNCRVLAGQSLKFAMAIDPIEAQKLSRRMGGAAKRPKKDVNPRTSKSKSSGQNKKARKK
ncbi:hypothetical protein HPB50_018348 [Hyalomma asiaticum]|uniref:Uncharacterized protein n=1 Tax=Hyalomma asiaticum TaxID=266040 RepID=A0ACB7RP99_HYAAI|nr:hypothetical protein HPB50_018348 [Hyalomma asiaticum]